MLVSAYKARHVQINANDAQIIKSKFKNGHEEKYFNKDT